VCAICLENYTGGDKLRVLPCQHRYHSECIDQWLATRRPCCPVCKADAHHSSGSRDLEAGEGEQQQQQWRGAVLLGRLGANWIALRHHIRDSRAARRAAGAPAAGGGPADSEQEQQLLVGSRSSTPVQSIPSAAASHPQQLALQQPAATPANFPAFFPQATAARWAGRLAG
jgi:hypothetical protein